MFIAHHARPRHKQLAVAALQKKYQESESVPTEQLVLDMRELLSTERVMSPWPSLTNSVMMASRNATT
jgi:hypothetical protein